MWHSQAGNSPSQWEKAVLVYFFVYMNYSLHRRFVPFVNSSSLFWRSAISLSHFLDWTSLKFYLSLQNYSLDIVLSLGMTSVSGSSEIPLVSFNSLEHDVHLLLLLLPMDLFSIFMPIGISYVSRCNMIPSILSLPFIYS